MLDGSLLALVAVLVGLVGLAWWRGGPGLVGDGLSQGGAMLLRFALLIALSFLAAGLAQVLVPRDWVGTALGVDSGLRGLVLAAGAGALTPSGPFVAMPLAAALKSTGAGTGVLVAYVTGWALLAVHRLVAWELPVLGARFALLRWAVSLALPVVAGLIARGVSRS